MLTLSCIERTQSNSRSFLPNNADDLLDNLQRKACPIFDASTPLIRSLVRYVLKELVDKVTVRAMNLNTVEAGSVNRIVRSFPEEFYVLENLFVSEGPRSRTTRLIWKGDI